MYLESTSRPVLEGLALQIGYIKAREVSAPEIAKHIYRSTSTYLATSSLPLFFSFTSKQPYPMTLPATDDIAGRQKSLTACIWNPWRYRSEYYM